MRNIYSALLTLFFVTGCSLTHSSQPVQMFVLVDKKTTWNEPGTDHSNQVTCPNVLVVKEMFSSRYLGSESIRFRKAPSTRGSYQFARWTETPPRRITTLLANTLRESGQFRAVAESSNGVQGDILLDTELLEFVHAIDSSPSKIELVVNAQIIDLKTRKILTQRRFSNEATASSADAEGAVDAFDQVTSEFLDGVLTWVVESCKQTP